MAYTQKPGRGNNAKTGNGLPTPFKQEDKYSAFGKDTSKGNPYDKWDTNNPNYKFREYANKQASQDSAAVATKAIKFGIGKREAGKMGSAAANAVRTGMGAGDLKVEVTTVPGGEKYTQKVKPEINPKTGAKVKVVPPTKQMKKSPMKQEKAKEKGFLDKAGEAISGAVGAVKKKAKEFDKYMKEGSSSDSRYGGKQDRFFGVQLSGKNAGKSEGDSKSAAKQMKPKVKAKTPAKMKKC